jgi:hypothetical protein
VEKVEVGFARQWHGRHISTAMSQHAALEKLLEAVFSVTQSVRLLLVFISTVIPGFSLLEMRDKDFLSVLGMHMFRNGVCSSMRRGVGLSV